MLDTIVMSEGDCIKERIDLFIEQYKLFIASFLFILIVSGGGFLVYQKNAQELSYGEKLSQLEERIDELETNALQPEIKTQTRSIEEQPREQQQIISQAPDASIVKEKVEISGRININTATATELDALPGIGPTYAKRIIEYRQQTGGFKSVDEIKNVKGIGDKTFDKFKDKITVQ